MQQFQIIKNFPGHKEGDIVDNSKFTDNDLQNKEFFSPFDPNAPWVPAPEDIVWTFQMEPFTFDVISMPFAHVIPTLGKLGFVFPDQQTAETARAAILASVASLQTTQGAINQKLSAQVLSPQAL